MRHANPSGDLAVVVERALDLLITNLEKKKCGKTSRPRPARPVKPGYISAATRRAVYERDGFQCTFVDQTTSQRCPGRGFIELDHTVESALGGTDRIENLRVRCRNHNQHSAKRTFGREHIDRKVNLRRRKSAEPLSETKTKALGALTTLGFKHREARRALGQLRDEPGIEPTLEQILRAALAILTA